ncbi:MAG TPA: AAA family ATPase [Phycisphaerales bacterium]|nr:AAA family ATPase [Phycisphaerales bacterium]
MRTLAIINQKGGSGKTTTAINLAAALARQGARTLLVDMDPQSHCALGLAIPEDQIDLQIGDALLLPTDRPIDTGRMLWRVIRNLDLAPSTSKLAGLEAARGGLADREDRDLRLSGVLNRLANNYDWCVVDCPPAIGLLTFNALRAATDILIPVETAFFALHGAKKQIATIKALARRMGAPTPFHVVPTMHDVTSNLASDVLAQISKHMGDCAVPHVIRLDPKLKEAASLGLPVVEFDPESAGAADYAALAEWFVCGGATKAHRAMRLDDDPPAPAEQESFHATDAGPVTVVTRAVPHRALDLELDVRPPALPISRAAELAARARRLAAQGQSLIEKLDADPDVARTVNGGATGGRAGGEVSDAARRPIAPFFGVRPTSQGLLFIQPGPATSRYFIAGNHNNWSPTATPMQYNSSLGVHEACLKVAPGQFRYRLVMDGRWLADPYNPNFDRNPYGEFDSVIEVVLLPSSVPAAPSHSPASMVSPLAAVG